VTLSSRSLGDIMDAAELEHKLMRESFRITAETGSMSNGAFEPHNFMPRCDPPAIVAPLDYEQYGTSSTNHGTRWSPALCRSWRQGELCNQESSSQGQRTHVDHQQSTFHGALKSLHIAEQDLQDEYIRGADSFIASPRSYHSVDAPSHFVRDSHSTSFSAPRSHITEQDLQDEYIRGADSFIASPRSYDIVAAPPHFLHDYPHSTSSSAPRSGFQQRRFRQSLD